VCPVEAPNLYTNGKIIKIHPNGLINYEENLTAGDGIPEIELVRMRRDKADAEAQSLRYSTSF